MNTPATAGSDFGSNQWLVEEMYEQYKSDKNAVDKSWWPVFEKFEAEGGASANGALLHRHVPGQGIVRLEREGGACEDSDSRQGNPCQVHPRQGDARAEAVGARTGRRPGHHHGPRRQPVDVR